MMPRRAAVRAVIVSVSLAGLLLACGGSPGATPATPESAGGATPAGPAADAGAPDAPTKSGVDHHREFIAGCAKTTANSPEYCECAWGAFSKTFTEAEMNAGTLPEARLATLKSQVLAACASKVPEETVKSNFTAGCVGKNAEMKSYCECTWTEFRKRFSPAELSDEGIVHDERFLTARTPVVKACGNKMPESVSKDAFMKGCAKDPSADKFCGCAWKELRKQASPAEIEAGTFEQKTAFAQVEKSCGKLRPSMK